MFMKIVAHFSQGISRSAAGMGMLILCFSAFTCARSPESQKANQLKGCPACQIVQNYKASGKPKVTYTSKHTSIRGMYHSKKSPSGQTPPPAPSATDPVVNVFLSNKHLSKDCRRKHYGNIDANSTWGIGPLKRGRGQTHSQNQKPTKHRYPGILDKMENLMLKPKAVEFWGKYGNTVLLDLKQPFVKFDNAIDENEKKVAFGQLPPDSYEKVVIYFEDDAQAVYESNPMPVKTYNRVYAGNGKPNPFALKSGNLYDIRISIDLQESLQVKSGYLKFEPTGDRIDGIEEISMENVQVRDREVLIQLSPTITEDQLVNLLENNKIDPFRIVPGVNYIQGFVREGQTTFGALAGALADPNVHQADFNYAMQGRAFADEPNFAAQKGVWDQIDLSEWHVALPGTRINVGVLDTGLDPANTDLNGAYSDFADPVTGEANPLDTSGHGTEIASIIAARINNFGIAGINPNANIIPVKVLTGPGTGDYVTLSQGIMYAAAKGAKIINLSLGGYVDNPILAQTISLLNGQGIIFVASAGNDATDIPVYPASYSQVISVASVNANNGLSSFSNFGETVDVAAPGEDIVSTSLGGALVKRSGTSYSAAIVSGLIANLLAENPNLTFDEISTLINKSSDFARRRYTTNAVGAGALNAKRLMRNLRNQTLNDVQIALIEPVQPSLVLNQPSIVRYVIENRGTQIVPSVTLTSIGQDTAINPQVASNLQPFERRELLAPYISHNMLDGLQSIESQFTFADENPANNKKQVTLAVRPTAPANLLLGRIKAVLVNADGEKLKFKVSVPVLNPTAYSVSNVAISLAETTTAQQETPVGTVTMDTIAPGEQAFFHFSWKKQIPKMLCLT